MRIGSLEFRPGRWPTLVTMALLCLLVWLGFWQLDRAAEKREILAQYGVDGDTVIIRLDGDLKTAEGLGYQYASAAGRYDSGRQFLLDNRMHKGRAGYQVITPLLLSGSDKAVLVNRGWISQGAGRQEIPDVRVGEEPRTLVGRIKAVSAKAFMLGQEEVRRDWPYRVQRIDLDVMAAELEKPLLPLVLLLDQAEPDGYVRDWQPLGFGPEKNDGYAVQWFGLAMALLIIYLTVNTRRVD